ncbi:trypsin-like peptidase domain-containing protein [Proteiniclasticum sp.]|uniref:S1C family serine protease n=1 Tax=Proteiniclasticum sp. TaxID=2053595 RepID=UPI00289A161F|nr:trypsin-like peptidase domain-containing protein [Proteiniclasticum sp.]
MDDKDKYGYNPESENRENMNHEMNGREQDHYDTQDYTEEFSDRDVHTTERSSYGPEEKRDGEQGRDGNYVYRGGSYYEGTREYEAPRKKKRFSILSLIASALIFTLLGTSLGIYSAYNVLPGTAFYNQSKLGQLIGENNGRAPVQVLTPELKEEGLTIPEIVSMVQPAVVTVSVQVPGGGSFFNPEGGYSESIGTGFILNEEGLIATNYHVVERGENIRVILYTGEEATAKVVNFDATNDLAVLQMDESVKVPGVVTLGDSDNIRVGESVIAIGNPLSKDFAGTVTSGIVSATERAVIVGNTEYNYIQTDAAINGGNSGGPLINARGEVIGINSAKISTDSVEGIGFAIPINTLINGLDALSRAQLLVGIAGREINASTADQNDIPSGVLVVEVQEDSPASRATMVVGDVITEFDGKKVTSVQEINEIKNTKKAGDQVVVKVYREGGYVDLNLTLVEKP